MSLENLAIELVLEIARHLEEPGHFNNLVRVNRTFYAILNYGLYQENITIHGSQALMWAAELGRYSTAARLLSMGADPNVRARDKETTALQTAVYHGWLGIVKMLLDFGADAGAKTSRVPRPLELALMLEHEEVAKMIADHRPDLSKGFALHIAAENGLPKAVRWLLESGEDVNAKSRNCRTPLWYALNSNAWKEDKFEAVLLLLRKGADPGCLPCCGPTAIRISARCQAINHRDERVRDLFEKLKKTCHCPRSWGVSPGKFRAFHQQNIRHDF